MVGELIPYLLLI